MSSFQGIKNIAYLAMTEFHDMGIASPTDVTNLSAKVDRHLSRIAIMTDAVTTAQDSLHCHRVIEELTPAYPASCADQKIGVRDATTAFWVIGARVCVQKSEALCQQLCPLVDHCKGMLHYDTKKGKYVIRRNGTRIDKRSHQEAFGFAEPLLGDQENQQR